MSKNSEFLLQKVGDNFYLARAGGGGSSSSGSHSSSSSHSSYSSSHSSYSSGSGTGVDLPWYWTALIVVVSFGLPILIIVLILKFSKNKSFGTTTVLPGYIDPEKEGTEEEKKLARRGREVFMQFQKAWSEFDIKSIKNFTSEQFYKKMTLELNVLKNYERQNLMDNVRIARLFIQKNQSYSDGFSVYVSASAKDQLKDLRENKTIFTDTSQFSEIWCFTKQNTKYVLNNIEQTTADVSKFAVDIAEFASKNDFFYDPDFGWLMMPTRGAIFGPAGFGNADINNHVIGYFRDKIVEFYSYEPKAGVGMQPMTVAQAILPRRYDDILVTEKSWYGFKPKARGLQKVETESVDFNKKFSVWAADADKATSFELLATNFMERIYALDFEINIEVIDNVLYLYSPVGKISYHDMLEVLNWAFEEMKM